VTLLSGIIVSRRPSAGGSTELDPWFRQTFQESLVGTREEVQRPDCLVAPPSFGVDFLRRTAADLTHLYSSTSVQPPEPDNNILPHHHPSSSAEPHLAGFSSPIHPSTAQSAIRLIIIITSAPSSILGCLGCYRGRFKVGLKQRHRGGWLPLASCAQHSDDTTDHRHDPPPFSSPSALRAVRTTTDRFIPTESPPMVVVADIFFPNCYSTPL
jgi:hypothetical protein